MAQQEKLTDSFVRSAKPPAGERNQVIHYDSEVKGFGVRVTRFGARAFILNYRARGVERRYTIGSYPDWRVATAREEAKRLKRLAQTVVDEHGGKVPRDFEALEKLPGVGHKTASVVMAQAFGEPAFPVDTHIHRLAARWGLSKAKDVKQTEHDLKKLFPRDEWGKRHLQMIYFGREYCPARNHDPSACPICSWARSSSGVGG